MIKYMQNLSQRCCCCDDYKMNAPFYEWHSDVTYNFLGLICRKCAVREMFGSNYNNNPRYKKWIEKEKERNNV